MDKPTDLKLADNAEVAKRRDRAIARALKTPPKPHKPRGAKPNKQGGKTDRG